MATQSTASSKLNVPPLYVFLGMLALMLAAAGAFYYFIYAPFDKQIAGITNEAKTFETQKAQLEKKNRELLAVQEEAEKIQSRLKILQDRLPSSLEEFDEFLSDINQRQQNARVHKWLRYAPLRPSPDGPELERVPIQMEFVGSFEAASAFFWELAEMGSAESTGTREQIVDVTNVSITRDKEGLVRIKCVAQTYLFRGVPEEAEDDGSGKRRRRRRSK